MKMTRTIMLIATGLTGFSVLAAACGGGTSSSDKTSTAGAGSASPARATTPASGGAVATSPAGATLDVTARDFEFNPTTLSASTGKPLTINFSNQGGTGHTFSLYTDQQHTKAVANGDTGTVSAGGSKTLTLPASAITGNLFFRCEIHPTQMMGEITVN